MAFFLRVRRHAAGHRMTWQAISHCSMTCLNDADGYRFQLRQNCLDMPRWVAASHRIRARVAAAVYAQ